MNNKFLIGIIIGFLLPAILISFFFYSFLKYGINQENLSYVSTYEFIDGKKIASKNENIIVIIVSTGCPGNVYTVPLLNENLIKLKEKNIKYIIVADELYSPIVDNELNKFKKQYQLDEKIYLMDINKYPENSGYFEAKKRYLEFVNDLTNGSGKNVTLGYTNYIILKDGKYLKSVPNLANEDFDKMSIK